MPSNDQIIEAALRKIKPLSVTYEMEFGGYSVRFFYPTPDQEIKYAIKVSEEEASAISFPEEEGSEILDFGIEQDHAHVVEECSECACLFRLGMARGYDRFSAERLSAIERARAGCETVPAAEEVQAVPTYPSE